MLLRTFAFALTVPLIVACEGMTDPVTPAPAEPQACAAEWQAELPFDPSIPTTHPNIPGVLLEGVSGDYTGTWSVVDTAGSATGACSLTQDMCAASTATIELGSASFEVSVPANVLALIPDGTEVTASAKPDPNNVGVEPPPESLTIQDTAGEVLMRVYSMSNNSTLPLPAHQIGEMSLTVGGVDCLTPADSCDRVWRSRSLEVGVVDGSIALTLAPGETGQVTAGDHTYTVHHARAIDQEWLQTACTDLRPTVFDYWVVRHP